MHSGVHSGQYVAEHPPPPPGEPPPPPGLGAPPPIDISSTSAPPIALEQVSHSNSLSHDPTRLVIKNTFLNIDGDSDDDSIDLEKMTMQHQKSDSSVVYGRARFGSDRSAAESSGWFMPMNASSPQDTPASSSHRTRGNSDLESTRFFLCEEDPKNERHRTSLASTMTSESPMARFDHPAIDRHQHEMGGFDGRFGVSMVMEEAGSRAAPVDPFSDMSSGRAAPVEQFHDMAPGRAAPVDQFSDMASGRVAPMDQFIDMASRVTPAEHFSDMPPGRGAPVDLFSAPVTYCSHPPPPRAAPLVDTFGDTGGTFGTQAVPPRIGAPVDTLGDISSVYGTQQPSPHGQGVAPPYGQPWWSSYMTPCMPAASPYMATPAPSFMTPVAGYASVPNYPVYEQHNPPPTTGKGSGKAGSGKSGGKTGEHTRTTIMLRNLPPEYTRDMMIELLDREGFSGLYDFVYMPMNLRTKESFGYVFVDLVTPVVADQCRSRFQGFSRWSILSEKVCDVLWSDEQQGLSANIERYRNSPVMHESVPEDCKPVVFANGYRMQFPPATKRLREPRIRRAVPKAKEREEEINL